MIAQPSESTPTESIAPVSLLETIQAEVQALSLDRQQQVLDFVQFLKQKVRSQNSGQAQIQPSQRTIWETIDEQMAAVPDEEWAKVPTDGSYQHDHYLYGTPKREL